MESVDKKCVHNYLNKKKEEIGSLINKKELKNTQIHDLRKRLKEYFYIHNALNGKKQNKFLTMTNCLQELLGEWHDADLMSDKFKDDIDKYGLKLGEPKLVEAVKVKLHAASEELYEKVIGEIERFKLNKNKIEN